MAISKSNFIVVYIYGNLDSEEFANYYAMSHDMEVVTFETSGSSGTTSSGIYWQVDGQKVGIELSDASEILTSSDFLINVEEPLLAALNSPELVNRSIWGVILGYKMPGGYYYDDDPSGEEKDIIISATSRLSRIKHTFSLKTENKLYNRQVFSRFNKSDAEVLLIVSRIDGPNLQFCKNIVDKAIVLEKQVFANGTFYIDPYSDQNTTGAEAYTELLVDFYNNMLSTLNLKNWVTTFMDPYIDSAIPYIENDSFVWSWLTDRATTSFFQISNAVRVFFYNADYDGGRTIRDENGKRWPFLSLDAGYVATAGSMSNPTIPGFLNPNAFFYALLRGATIGEAFYFSVPHVDWTVSLFGDPLVVCSFPGTGIIDDDSIGEHAVWEMMSKDLAKAASYLYAKERELKEMLYEIVDITTSMSGDDLGIDILDILLAALPFEGILIDDPTYPSVILLHPAYDLWANNQEGVWEGQLKALVNKLFDFPTFRYFSAEAPSRSPTINEYLSDNGFKVSRLLADITSESKPIDDANLLDEGWWQFEFVLEDDDSNFVNYHFILEVSSEEDFSDISITKDSIAIDNWTYEKEKEVFVPMTSNGVSSSYVGRKIRYEREIDALISVDESLERGTVYYFRVTQYNISTLEQYGSRIFSDIIYT